MVYLENVILLSKLIGLLFLFCLPLLSIWFLKTKRNNLARPIMGTIFLVCRYVGVSRMSKELRRRYYVAHAHAQRHFWAAKTDL